MKKMVTLVLVALAAMALILPTSAWGVGWAGAVVLGRSRRLWPWLGGCGLGGGVGWGGMGGAVSAAVALALAAVALAASGGGLGWGGMGLGGIGFGLGFKNPCIPACQVTQHSTINKSSTML